MTNPIEQPRDFDGLQVVAFESRRAKEMASLITHYRGKPRVAPSLREIPLQENSAAFAFAEELFAGKIDAVVFMTGVGTQTLVEALQTRYPREKIVRALSQLTVVARGPKPIKVLRELEIPIALAAPEPHTWQEILRECDRKAQGFQGKRVAVQEYGASNETFLQELRTRGAEPLRVPVYRWALPEDIAPLRKALEALLERQARVVLFTNAVQVDHVLRVAATEGLKERLLESLRGCVVCSVGPTCSEALVANGICVDVQPEQHKMGMLVHEAAWKAPALLREKTKPV